VAGLAGQEEILLFLIGFCLVLLEIFLAPGLFLPAVLGLVLMLGSLLWAMIDIWPGQEIDWSIASFRVPLLELAQSLAMAFGLGFLAMKIIAKTSIAKSMILQTSSGGNFSNDWNVDINQSGVTLTELYPVGKVEINGKTYEARSSIGKIEKGETVKVIKKSGYELLVEKEAS
jgi:membrane-bound serine protease (ClpP class)